MAKTPIETMLDGVQWVARDNPAPEDSTMPYATHVGVLDVFGHKLRCYRLNTGMAVFDADDVASFFGVEETPPPDYDDEYMCPNCVTPWKCNGPHIEPNPTDAHAQGQAGEEKDG